MHVIKMVTYGASGLGKTTFVGTANDVPELHPILMADMENGTMSIKSRCVPTDISTLKNPSKDKINVLRIKSFKELRLMVDFLYSNPNVYKTLIIDSITESNYMALTDTLSISSRELAQIQDYGRVASLMRSLIRELRDIDELNVFITGLANEVLVNGLTVYRPNLIGKLSGEIPALVDILGYYDQDRDGNRIMYFTSDKKFLAKDRSEGGALGDFIEEPTIPKIYNLIKGVK
jgi:hypothetical protein